MHQLVNGSRFSISRKARRFARHEHGYSVVELAMISPLLAYLLVAVFDFARVFYFAMAVTSAAHAAVQWGSLSPANTLNSTRMQTIAANHAPGLGVTATAGRVCRCGSGTATPYVQLSCATSCPGTQRIYASVTATRSFSPIIGFPGIPGTMNITRTAQMRAQ